MPEWQPLRKLSTVARCRPENGPPAFQAVRRSQLASLLKKEEDSGPAPRSTSRANSRNASLSFGDLTLQSESADERPHYDPPPTSLPRRRWWALAAFRVGVLALNAFVTGFYPFLIRHFQQEIRKDISITEVEWQHLEKYWTKVVCSSIPILLALVADSMRSRRSASAICAAIGGLCVLALAFVHGFGLLLFLRIVMGIVRWTTDVLSISIISDMLSWPEAFLGIAIYQLPPYLGYTIYDRFIRLIELAQGREWQHVMIASGVFGIAIATLMGFVVREPQPQESLITGAGGSYIYREGRAQSGCLRLLKRRTSQAAEGLAHMMKVKTVSILTLSMGIQQTASTSARIYIPLLLETKHLDNEDLLGSYLIMLSAAGSVSVVSGAFACWTAWRLSRRWLCISMPLWLCGVGLILSIPFIITAILSYHNRSLAKSLRVFKGSFVTSLALSDLGAGILPALLIALLTPRYKSFGFAVCAFFERTVSASGVEIIRLMLRNRTLSSAKEAKVMKRMLATAIVVCSALAAVGLFVTTKAKRMDTKGPDQLGRLTVGRKAAFAGVIIVAVGVIMVLVAVDAKG